MKKLKYLAAPLAKENAAKLPTLVRDSGEFQVALVDENVERIVYQGRLTVEYELNAGTKTIESANPDSQSVRMIYEREYNDGRADYNLLAGAAEGWVGWYEYHEPNGNTEYRLCNMLYYGSWEDAVEKAEDLTAGPLEGETNPEEGLVSFAGRPELDWRLILVDGNFRPVCGKLEITE